jgi:beta-glucosidase
MDQFREQARIMTGKLTLTEKMSMLTSHLSAVPRLGIGEFFIGTEVARGYVSHGEGGKETDISTVFPQPVGLASTFDRELMTKLGEIAAEELRHYWQTTAEKKSKLMLFGPTVDPLRDPRWGRNEEAYGEDPYLAGEQAKCFCAGLVGDGKYMKTAPGLKHFCAYNHEENRAEDNADETMKLLNEYYYAPYKKIIENGYAAGVMAAYNEIGGVPAVMNPDLKTKLKGEWGADYVVTDGGDFSQNYLSHKHFSSHAETFAYTVKNGTDSMLDNPEMVANAAYEALRQGLITEADIDLAVENVLTVRHKLGEFDPECTYNTDVFEFDTDEFKAINKRAVYEQVCLLDNDGILPVKSENINAGSKKIALVGPIADEIYNDWYTGTASYGVTIKSGMENVFGKDNILFDNGYDHVNLQSFDTGNAFPGTYEWHDWGSGVMTFKDTETGLYLTEQEDGGFEPTVKTVYDWFIRSWFKPAFDTATDSYTFRDVFDKPIGFVDNKLCKTDGSRPEDGRFTINGVSCGKARAAKHAKEADFAVAVVGNQPMLVARECYDRKTLELPPQQAELVRAVCAANPNTILVICSSYPYILGDLEDKVRAVIYTTHAGAELGNAVAETIAGLNNPAARTPQTWYRYDSDLPADLRDYRIDKTGVTYKYFKGTPLYPFGHGLSYSNFRYDNAAVSIKDGVINCTANITNVSDTDGDEVAQIYVKRENTAEIKSLCGYKRVFIKSGETTAVAINIPIADLAEYNPENGQMMPLIYDNTESIKFEFGASSADIRAVCEISVSEADGFTRLHRDYTKRTLAKNFDRFDSTALKFDFKKNDWYVTTIGWGGSIGTGIIGLTGVTSIEIAAAAPNAPAKLTVSVTYADVTDGKIVPGETEVLGEIEVKPSISHTDFAYYTLPIEIPDGKTTGMLTISAGTVNIWSVQLAVSEQ